MECFSTRKGTSEGRKEITGRIRTKRMTGRIPEWLKEKTKYMKFVKGK